MESLWFCLVTFMLIMYAILDGFDIGAGILHLFVARTDSERRTILNAIGPVWDGNEVWLVAAGGTLYFAFPLLYASAFSGFYLPLMIVLWLLILRALGIEFRHHLHNPLWKTFWDANFAIGSIMLATFFGVALGNIVRGVPLQGNGYFFSPLWTTFTVVSEAGILDWFTLLMGLVSLCTLTNHGANFLALKSEGKLHERAHHAAGIAWWGTLLTSAAALAAVSWIRPLLWRNFQSYPWGYALPLASILGFIGMKLYTRKGQDLLAFLSSATFIAGMLASTAFGLFPNALTATTDSRNSLTVYNTISHEYGLHVGIIWWSIGGVIAVGYCVFLFRSFKGKVTLPAEEDGY